MSLLTANDLCKRYGPEEIFSGISLDVPQGARIALVGPNGAGKTSLLNLLAGRDTPDEGSIARSRGLRIGYLTQRPELAGEHPIWDEMLGAFEGLIRMESRLRELEAAMADPAESESALKQYGELQHRFEEAGGYTYEGRIKMVLGGLGFKPEDYDKPLPQLSGGQRTRVLLGRLLLDAPDLLALDEPTNHLDIGAIEWLEQFLKDFPGTVIAVSHDRYFMDAFASTIWELDFGALESYRGNYSHYVRQRQERYERRLKEYEAQQEYLEKEMEYIRRNIAGQNTRQAKGKLRRLETMRERGALKTRPRLRQTVRVQMASSGRSGDKVLMTRDLVVGYAGQPLFQTPPITLWRGEVAALIGPNGVGKSTLLKTLIGQVPPLAGEARLGASVTLGYFAQAHELLDPARSVIDEILAAKPMMPAEARSFLGSYLFHGDDVFRPIGTLSGGERGRVALAKLALSGANLLLLDEPTNHLDIESQEMLQNVLAGFDGTILLVTHDRYLVDALATQIWAARPGALDVFEGSYAEYLAARQAPAAPELASASSPAAKAPAARGGLNPYQRARRVAELEGQIAALEAQVGALSEQLACASPAQMAALAEAYTHAEDALNLALEEWAELAE